jgi:hypothetical protein
MMRTKGADLVASIAGANRMTGERRRLHTLWTLPKLSRKNPDERLLLPDGAPTRPGRIA